MTTTNSTPARNWARSTAKDVELTAGMVPQLISQEKSAAALVRLMGVQDRLDRALICTVWLMRSEGNSWAVIGDLLGTSRQAAQMRFGAVVTQYEEESAGRRLRITEGSDT